MEAGAVAHDLGRQQVALDHLHHREDHEHRENAHQASVVLEEGQRQGGAETDDVAQVGDDVEEAEGEADHETVLETDDRKTDGKEQSLQEGDDELAAEECDDDVEELLEEVQEVLSGLRFEEGDMVLEVFDSGGVGHEEEGEIDGGDGPAHQRADPGDHTCARGHRTPTHELKHADKGIALTLDRLAGGLADLGLNQQVLDLWCVDLGPLNRRCPPPGTALNEALGLVEDQAAEEPPEGRDRDDRGQKHHDQRQHPPQLETGANGLVEGFDHHRGHRGHRHRQEDG